MIVQGAALAGAHSYCKTSHLQGKLYFKVWTVLNAPEDLNFVVRITKRMICNNNVIIGYKSQQTAKSSNLSPH